MAVAPPLTATPAHFGLIADALAEALDELWRLPSPAYGR